MTYNLIKRNFIQLFCLTLFVCSVSIAEANVRIVAVNQSLKQITFKNFGAEQDIASWRLCSNLRYTFGGMDGDATITVIAGDYLLSTDEEMTVEWTPSNGFRASGDDIGIYLPSGGFSDPAAMVDFMQYLTPGNGRESVAVAKGIWGTGDFVTGGPYSFTGTGTDTGVTFWSGIASVDGCTDPTASNYDPAVTNDDGSCLYDVVFNVDLSCYDGNDPNIDVNTPGGFTTISIEGPSLDWCGSCVTLTDDGAGLWSVTLSLPAGPFEYKYAHDDFAGQEQLIDDMLNGGSCAPITDLDTFANREIIIPATLETNDTYGSCDACNISDPCPTDFDGNGVTDGDDFSNFLGNFGLPCSGCPTDIDGNGATDGDDFSIFLGNFGLPCGD